MSQKQVTVHRIERVIVSQREFEAMLAIMKSVDIQHVRETFSDEAQEPHYRVDGRHKVDAFYRGLNKMDYANENSDPQLPPSFELHYRVDGSDW